MGGTWAQSGALETRFGNCWGKPAIFVDQDNFKEMCLKSGRMVRLHTILLKMSINSKSWSDWMYVAVHVERFAYGSMHRSG
jgi:hypothetical protein